MAAVNNINYIITDLTIGTQQVVPLGLPPTQIDLANKEFDLSRSWAVDFDINSTNAVGRLDIYLYNSDPETFTAQDDPVNSFPISGGTFSGGQLTQSIDANYGITMKYLVFSYIPTSGTGTLIAKGHMVFQ